MASLSHPTSLTNNPINSPFLHNSLLSKPCQLSALKSHRQHRHVTKIVSSQANRNTNNDQQQPSSFDNSVIDLRKLDRRNMLIGLGGMYGAATTLATAGTPTAMAAPANPEVKNCYLTSTSGGGPEGLECCPPSFKNVVDFDFRNYPNPKLKVRRPAHLVSDDPEYMAKFKEAVRRMKALPRSDPRNFIQQANVHCAYCDGSYRQVGYNKIDLLVHGSWLFFPFHRAYLYFFERILGKLIDDPNFAMPYWNWDHPDGMRMPTIYTNPDSPLYDVLRDPAHQPPRLADLNYNNVDANISDELQTEYNLRVMNYQMKRNSKPELFMGSPLLAGQPTDDEKGTGALENVPHNVLHVWVGDRNDDPFHRDMGSFFSAGRDPLFYCHHSNVDRMWHVWNKDLGNENFTTRDWLDTYFLLYDENGKAVRISTRDCLDIEKLGYSYADQDLPWNNIDTSNIPTPTPVSSTTTVTFPKTLDSVIRTRVARPKSSRSQKEKEVAKEVVKVSVKVEKEDEYIKFDVFINDGQSFDDNTSTVIGRTYAGSFTSVPHKTRKGGQMNMNRRIALPLTDILEDLGADGDDYVDVVIVPRAGKGNVVIKDVKIDYVI